MRLAYARFASPVKGLGPGQRVVLWVSGCSIRCSGCMTPELFVRGGDRDVRELAEELVPYLREIPHLTISGGEPFEQAEAVAELINAVREQVVIDVVVYTGFVIETLRQRGGAYLALLDATDILIDGPFVHAAANTKAWRGSDNQRVHLLSAAARAYGHPAHAEMEESRHLQFAIANGELTIIGIPRRGDLERLRSLLQQQRAFEARR